MPKYMLEGSYTAQGLKGLAKDKASGRKAAVAKAIKKLGGKLESMHYCLGKSDVVLIFHMPDSARAAAFSVAAGSSGLVTAKTTALLTTEEMDEALSLDAGYRAPGA